MSEAPLPQNSPRYINLPRFADERGNLSFLQYPGDSPFDIKRVFYLSGMPEGSTRGAHAHKTLEEVIVVLHGSCIVKTYDGHQWQSFSLDRPDRGLYIPPLYWGELTEFAPDTVVMVLCSDLFIAEDYLSPLQEYLDYMATLQPGKSK